MRYKFWRPSYDVVFGHFCMQDCRQITSLYSACLYETTWSRFVASSSQLSEYMQCPASCYHVLLSCNFVFCSCSWISFSLASYWCCLHPYFFYSFLKLLWFWVLMMNMDLVCINVIQPATSLATRYVFYILPYILLKKLISAWIYATFYVLSQLTQFDTLKTPTTLHKCLHLCFLILMAVFCLYMSYLYLVEIHWDNVRSGKKAFQHITFYSSVTMTDYYLICA